MKRHALTRSEAQVIATLVRGLSTNEISAQRGASVYTVRTQIKRAMTKMGVHTQVGLVARALALDE